jgi:DNA repair protein NreA
MEKSGYSQRDAIKFNFSNLDLSSLDFFGNSPPAVFVGRFGYPKVNVGVLSPVQKEESSYLMDNPKEWVKLGLKDHEILKLRVQLVNARFQSPIKNFDNRLLNLSQEVGMAHKPVDMEVSLKNKPKNILRMENVAKPLSNNANVKNIKLTENPKIKTIVDKTVSDGDMKAVEGIYKLYNKGFDDNFLSKILSIGLLGKQKNRKLVPTRWSITATDDTIAKESLKEIRFYQEVDYQAYFSGYLGNYYLILLFPDVWGFELFEMEVPLKTNPWSKHGSFYATDYEDYFGRKNYTDECGGGYFACRIGILEKLNELRRQGGVLVFRFINNDDKIPLGVWVCREATRMSLRNKVNLDFDSKESLLNYAKAKVSKEFGVDLNYLLKVSKLMNRKSKQKRLASYL